MVACCVQAVRRDTLLSFCDWGILSFPGRGITFSPWHVLLTSPLLTDTCLSQHVKSWGLSNPRNMGFSTKQPKPAITQAHKSTETLIATEKSTLKKNKSIVCAITSCYRASLLSPQTSSLMVYIYLEKADAWWKHRAACPSWSLCKLQWVWGLWVCDPRGRGLQRASPSGYCWNEYTVIAAPLFCSLRTFWVSNHSCRGRGRERAQESALLAVRAGVPRTNWGWKIYLDRLLQWAF